MAGGKIIQPKTALNRQSSFAFAPGDMTDPAEGSARPSLEHQGSSFGISGLQVDEEEEDATTLDPRSWLKIVHAYEQPRLVYDMNKKHFEKVTTKPSLLPSPSHKTTLFRDRYNIIHQRLMRSEAFQAPSVNQRSLARSDSTSVQQFYKITPISNLLGRDGSSHVILGLLTVTPTGTLALNDMTGSIILDLQHAKPIRGDHSAWFCPGMIILIEGVYEEEYSGAGASGLGNTTGVGGTIGGKFIGFMISGPPSEKRSLSLGVPDASTGDLSMSGAFGWTDFLGLGSERAMGPKMRRLEQKILGPDSPNPERKKMIMMNEVNLDDPSALEALRSVLALYASEAEETPLSFVLVGNFVSHPVMAGGGSGGSIDYKEYFNDLATVLVDYPSLLRNATWVFVPGDNDPWPSAYSAGASTAVPRKEIPALFTSRIKRAFAVAKAEAGVKRDDGPDGEVIWTSNPARISLFGSAHEVVVFRDDVSGRLRRTAITFGRAARQEEAAEEEEEANDDDSTSDSAMQDANPPDSAITHTLETDMQLDPPEPSTPDNTTTTTPSSSAKATATTTAFARKLVLSLLPQSHLSPFPLATRPVHWDYGSALSLYPLPHTLVLADAEAPAFAVTFEGCHVINPGRLVREEGKRRRVGWVEYDCWSKRGEVREMWC